MSNDEVNHPVHYTAYEGIEVVQLTEQMNFNRGNAVKYIARAGLKSYDTEILDLQKALWYIQREINRVEAKRRTAEENEALDALRARLTAPLDECEECDECDIPEYHAALDAMRKKLMASTDELEECDECDIPEYRP